MYIIILNSVSPPRTRQERRNLCQWRCRNKIWIRAVVYWRLIFQNGSKYITLFEIFQEIFRFTSTYQIKVVGVCDRDVLIKQHEFIIKIFSLFVQKLVFLSDLYTENASWITNKDLPCLEYLSGLCKKNTFSVLVPIFITGLPRVIITYQTNQSFSFYILFSLFHFENKQSLFFSRWGKTNTLKEKAIHANIYGNCQLLKLMTYFHERRQFLVQPKLQRSHPKQDNLLNVSLGAIYNVVFHLLGT